MSDLRLKLRWKRGPIVSIHNVHLLTALQLGLGDTQPF